jgi:hypothetical protein
VIFYLYVVPYLLDFAIGANQEGAADDALVRAAHEFLQAPHAVGFDHLVVRITEQGEIEFLFGPEFGESFFGVRACAQDQHADFFEVLLCVTKLGRLGRSTGGVGFRKEEHHNAPAAKIREGERRAFIGLEPKVRGLIAYFQHGIQ